MRAVAGMTPFCLVLVDTLGTNPDLYGPFWLAVTLIITNAVCGNVSKFIQWVRVRCTSPNKFLRKGTTWLDLIVEVSIRANRCLCNTVLSMHTTFYDKVMIV